MKKILMLTAAVLVFQATSVFAQPAEKGMHQFGAKMFTQKDINGDGVISEPEFLEYAKKRFAMVDADSSGSISKEEAKEFHALKREQKQEMRAERREKRLGNGQGKGQGRGQGNGQQRMEKRSGAVE